jgi:hypothetical protein
MAYQPHVQGTVDAGNSTSATLPALGVFTGIWREITTFDGISVLVDGTAASAAPGSLLMQFSHDGVTVHRSIPITVDDIAATPPRTLGVIAQFFRIVYNNGAVAHTATDIQTMLHAGFVQLVSRLDSVVGDDEDVRNVRAFIGGLDVLASTYENVSVAESTNVAGTYHSLQVASGARPSQLPGRTAVTVLADNETAPALLYTVTSGKTYYVTDIVLTIANSGTVTGRLEIYDALSATGSPILPINAADPGSGGDDTLTTITHTFSEPLPFLVGVFFDEAASVLTMSGILIGYEE